MRSQRRSVPPTLKSESCPKFARPAEQRHRQRKRCSCTTSSTLGHLSADTPDQPMTARIFNFFVTLKGTSRLSGCQLFSYTSERLGAKLLLERCLLTSISCRSNNNNCIECRKPRQFS